MAETLQQVLMWAAAVIAAFVVYRLFFGPKKNPSASTYERQIDEILTSEEYKVKGRFE